MNKQESDPFSELRQLRRTLSPVASDNKINISDFAPKEIIKQTDEKKKSVKRRRIASKDGGDETFLLDDSEEEADKLKVLDEQEK
jgi:hypothetical protein